MIAGLQVGLSVELHILQIIASGIDSAEKSFTSQDTTRRRRRRRRRRRTFIDLYRSGSLPSIPRRFPAFEISCFICSFQLRRSSKTIPR